MLSTNNNDSIYKDLEILSGKDFIAGWISGVASISIGHPLETIKVRQQTTTTSGSAAKYFVLMLKNEGMRCFFRGISYPLFTTGILNSLYFGFYGNALRFFENVKGESHFRSCCDEKFVYKGWHWDCFYAGLVGGTVSTLINSPFELAKTVLQAHAVKSQSKQTLTPTKCLLSLFRTCGLRGCYHGSFILFVRDVPAFGLYAICYEHISCMQKNLSQSSPSLHIMYEGIAGGFAGVITWFLALPFDVVKSRYMSDSLNGKVRKYSGTVDCAVKTFREGGMRAFYRGLWITVFRAFPVNLVCFVVYERTLNVLNKNF